MMATVQFFFGLVMIYISPTNGLTNLPFSWDKVPVFAFPGDQNTFLSSSQIEGYNFTQFNDFLIWGFNVSCINISDGRIYPASHPKNSFYTCANNSFNPNLESSLAFQSQMLKQNISTNTTVLSYVKFTAAQQTYIAQNIFNQPQNSKWWLTLQNAGTINCFNASYHCQGQGPAYHNYDLRQKDVQNYFVNDVCMSITNSSFVTGLFLDEVDNWLAGNDRCHQWGCTQNETQEIADAIIDTLELLFSTHKAKYGTSKVFSISVHANMYGGSSYIYFRQRTVLEKYSDIAIRFYEDFSAGGSNFNTYLNETNYGRGGLSQQVHAAGKTMNPDWVELAAFLIGANNQSWFSYSNGWQTNSHWYQPEFGNRLGKPMSAGNCSLDAKNNPMICTRTFQFCDVWFNVTNRSATLTWK
eukprot:554964_1